MQRAGIGIDAKNLSWMYQNNTLIISVIPKNEIFKQYTKPTEIIEYENKRKEHIKKSITETGGAEEGKVDCKQQ